MQVQIVCMVPEPFVPMLDGKYEIDLLKKGTTLEQLKIECDLNS